MSENNKTYRIRTKIGVTEDSPINDKYLTVKLTDKIDNIEIMSLKIKQENAYKFHSADYGVVVGRAIANGGFGVPNVKVSVFIAATEATKNDAIYNAIYPYERVTQKNKDNIRYNLLPDVGDDDCYQVVGTFPNKRLVLDDDNYLEIYDNYYKFTTRTNNAGDYMIFGIPTGGQILHFDADLSDVGVLSQRPRDMIYKGYNINQFENANQFKKDDNLANLPQIISQDDSVYIYPFWGEEDENIIGITRHDIDINYKFEPTCVFMGSIASDTNSNHISKKCIPTAEMGMMEELITGSGTIEMIRKKQDGSIEQYNIKGTQLIDDNGVWCYQIPMNLDYYMTDEYGNLVPSDDPTKGIATRTSVRFRFSMQDFENDSVNSFRTKVLVPNNPQNNRYEPDYVFGSFTEDESFRDLLWNNVYTVKSFIPRFQKGNGNRSRRFSGIKQCNYHGQNNPIPYNNMRINLSFQFVITCLIVRLLIWMIGVYNAFITAMANVLSKFVNLGLVKGVVNAINSIDDWRRGGHTVVGRIVRSTVGVILYTITLPLRIIKSLSDFFTRTVESMSCIYIDGSMCEALEGSWFFAPNCSTKGSVDSSPNKAIWLNMFAKIEGKKYGQLDYSSSKSKTGGGMEDAQSINNTNADDRKEEENQVTIIKDGEEEKYSYVISRGINYFVQCIEISLAQEFRVVQFDFYNDWINGLVYIPRWERSLKRKRKYFLFGKTRVEVRACNDVYKKRFFERRNYLTEQCAVSYKAKVTDNSIGTKIGCKDNKKYKCHKKRGRKQFNIFREGGVVHEETTASGLYAYYFKPCEYITNRNPIKNRKVNLFATDVVLLGSLVDCDLNGTPLFTNELTSTTYQIPAPLAHTDSTEEGFTYRGETGQENLHVDDTGLLNGVFDFSEAILNPQDDGSITEESGIDWGYTGPGQGEVKKAKTYTPGGHFLGISCVNAESSIKSCVNLKRICEVGVWPSSRQEVFNGYDAEKNGSYLDIIPNGLIAKDDISGGNFRKIFATMNHNNLRTKVNANGFTVYDFSYMTPENFGGDLQKYTRGNYNEANPVDLGKYLAHEGDKNDYDETYEEVDEGKAINIKPIRRSLDNRDSDYMRFRLGLKNDNNTEIQTKYLGNDDFGYYMPVFDNSYYFYFGLIPGSTALDEFHKQFFAECKHTMSTEDLRLNATLSYNGSCCDGKPCKNIAFEKPVEISIFDTSVTFNVSEDSLRIFSTAVPIKVTVDSKYSYIIKEADQEKVYIDFTGWTETELGRNVLDFELGKHTVHIVDSNGRSVTKLVEIVQQEIILCPNVEGFSFNNEKYIINSTKSLISGEGSIVGGRENLGGWFNFEWNSDEEGCEPTTLFKYRESTDNCSGSTYTTVFVSNVTMLFVSKSHIIKIGSGWTNNEIVEFEEFLDYNPEDDIFNGRFVSSNGYHAYAGEEGNYDFYILYRNGNRSTIPILLKDNIYIGEPDAIDFDVFRTIVESEDDAPVTYRNPIVKVWYATGDNWFKNMYNPSEEDEFSNEQKWYVRKNIFFNYITGNTDTDEYYTSERTSQRRNQMVVNLYYPSTIGNVNCYIDGNNTTNFDKTSRGATVPGSIIEWHKIYVSGSLEDNTTVVAPISGYGDFRFPIIYKPYYYKAVIWEGYAILSIYGTGNTLSYAQAHGVIYNGVVFDESNGVQVFGPTLINERIRIDSAVNDNVAFMSDDFVAPNNRTTMISYYGDGSTVLSESTNKLTITEGSPKYVEYSEYTPVEYSIEAGAIGNPSNFVVDFEMVITSSERYAKFIVTFDDNEYERINWYWGYKKPLTDPANQAESLQPILDYENMLPLRLGYESDGTYGHVEGLGENWVFEIPLNTPSSANGIAREIESGSLLLESIEKDKLTYSSDITQRSLGHLSSRNFVRNGINIDYSYDKNRLEQWGIKVFIALSDAYLKNNGRKFSDRKIRNNDPTVNSYGIRFLYVKIPFGRGSNELESSKKFRRDVGMNRESVFVTYKDNGGIEHTYDLINELGYDLTYKDGYLYVELSQAYPENSAAFNEGDRYSDNFTEDLTLLFFNHGTGSGEVKKHEKRYEKEIPCTFTITSLDIGKGLDGEYDSIGKVTATFDAMIIFTNEEASLNDNTDDD